MELRTSTGRRLVLAIIVASLAISVLVIVAFTVARGTALLPQQIVRFLLTVGLCVFLYRGANWARWVAVILFALGGVMSLVGASAPSSTSMSGLLLLLMGLVYAASALILLLVPTVRAHFGVGNTKTG